jgi:hypothetical protein
VPGCEQIDAEGRVLGGAWSGQHVRWLQMRVCAEMRDKVGLWNKLARNDSWDTCDMAVIPHVAILELRYVLRGMVSDFKTDYILSQVPLMLYGSPVYMM